MSATVAGSVKAHGEAGGLSLPFFRDEAPAGTPLPYAVVQEGIASTPEPGDFGAADATLEVRETVQIDVWQAVIDPATGNRAERYGLAQAVVRRFRGAALPDVLGGRCYPARVLAARRLPSGEKNVVRDTIDLQIVRQIGVQ